MHKGPIPKLSLAISSSALVMWEPSLLYSYRCELGEDTDKSMVGLISIWANCSRSLLTFFYPSLAQSQMYQIHLLSEPFISSSTI